MPVRHTHEWLDPVTKQVIRQFAFKASPLSGAIAVQWTPPLPLIIEPAIAKQMLTSGYARFLYQHELDEYNKLVDAYNAQVEVEPEPEPAKEPVQQAPTTEPDVDAAQVKALADAAETERLALLKKAEDEQKAAEEKASPKGNKTK